MKYTIATNEKFEVKSGETTYDILERLTFDNTPSSGSSHAVKSSGIYDAINNISLNFVKKPNILYETDGTTGILGVNSNTLGNSWQLEGYDFTPYKFLRCYIKVSDYSQESNYLTPAIVVTVPLDNASRSKGVNDTVSTGKVPCDMYIGGGGATNPSDRNVSFNVLVAVDSTKTKLQVVSEHSIYGTALGGRNDNGRYLYKIEGCYDEDMSGNEDTFIEHDPIFTASPAYGITSNDITSWNNKDKTQQVSGTQGASVTIEPYKLYDFGTLSTAMTVSFDTTKEVSGYTREYIMRFVAGSGCAVTLPNGVKYANGTAPTYTSGREYEINVINGCAVVGEFY